MTTPSPLFTRHRSFARALAPVLLVTGVTLLSGCAQIADLAAGATKIETIQDSPSDYRDVTVRGEVVNQFGVLGRGAYQVRDRSGEIWIVTQSGLPDMGATVVVNGTAEAGITIGGRALGVTLTERDRR
ncbi:MAG: hypothetical protein AAFY15_00560 [Cyanobacteria bacterium J06648_11]